MSKLSLNVDAFDQARWEEKRAHADDRHEPHNRTLMSGSEPGPKSDTGNIGGKH